MRSACRCPRNPTTREAPAVLGRRDLLDDAGLAQVHHQGAGPVVAGGLVERRAPRGDPDVGAEPLGGGQDLGAEDEVADGEDHGHARV